MDINILLGFQEFRNGIGSCLTAFMTKMSYIGEMNTVLIFTALIYWCVSKNFGTYLLMGWSGNLIVNGLLKVSACVYRPWIRDPEKDIAVMCAGIGISVAVAAYAAQKTYPVDYDAVTPRENCW
ncbi:MAG: hypothetical protein K5760_01175 [Clostridium sp.]|nr:hypothetical protein [Clostridium sp.]